MILLLGGTSETAPVAEALAAAGYRVLVSTATDAPLFIGSHPAISHRHGRLDADGMIALIHKRGIRAIVDATHPYALQVRATAASVAEQTRIPYLNFLRPPSAVTEDAIVSFASNHEEAARLACQTGKPVLLTTGSRNVRVYAEAARQAGVLLIARVLDHSDSLQACREAGIPRDCLVTGRGPFSVAENRTLLRQFRIGVLVTKDSGDAGGVAEKLEAARCEGCKVIVVGRPEAARGGGLAKVEDLVHELERRVPPAAPRGPCAVLAIDLESILVPEIWHTVADVAGVPELAATTRDCADYDTLMQRRIRLCREHGLALPRLLEIVAVMEPLPGAVKFLAWAGMRALVVVVSDTFHELAGPLMAKLGGPLMLCNALKLDADGFIGGYEMRDPAGKAGAVAAFKRLGFRVLAVGDSFNDLAMLHAADAAFLFRPARRVLETGVPFPALSTFEQLQAALDL